MFDFLALGHFDRDVCAVKSGAALMITVAILAIICMQVGLFYYLIILIRSKKSVSVSSAVHFTRGGDVISARRESDEFYKNIKMSKISSAYNEITFKDRLIFEDRSRSLRESVDFPELIADAADYARRVNQTPDISSRALPWDVERERRNVEAN